MAAPIPINITNKILHYAIFKQSGIANFVTYKNFLKKNPVVESFTDSRCDVKVNFSKEKWRNIWLTMIVVSFDVRNCGYTLSAKTFEDDNMVIVDGHHLRFLKFWPDSAEPMATTSSPRAPDLSAVADKIEGSLMGQPPLTDVSILTDALRKPINDPKFSPLLSYRKAFIRCNYALMSNSMRIEFHIWLWENLNNPLTNGFENLLYQVCATYEGQGGADWRNEVCRKRGSPMSSVFYFEPNAYPGDTPIELAKFIRHALRNLPEHGYAPDATLFLAYGYLANFMSTVQDKLIALRGLSLFELFMFQPVAH